jgi:hypothetical protein
VTLKTLGKDYRRLTHPEIPPGWLFCGSCGHPMRWRDIPGSTYSRYTGQLVHQWHYICTNGLTRDHDDYKDGDALAAYLWEAS